MPARSEQQVLDNVPLHLLTLGDTFPRERFRDLMEQHHYLRSGNLVGEQLRHIAEVDGRWVALLSWSAAANHLNGREQWLGWAQGWSPLGETQGSERSRQDYYTEHGRPKQLSMRELAPKARTVLCSKPPQPASC